MGYVCMSFLLASKMRHPCRFNLQHSDYTPELWILSNEASAYLPKLQANTSLKSILQQTTMGISNTKVYLY